jgi:hypothetical protein
MYANKLSFLIFFACVNCFYAFGQGKLSDRISLIGFTGFSGRDFPLDTFSNRRATQGIIYLKLGAIYDISPKISLGVTASRPFLWGNMWLESERRIRETQLSFFLMADQELQIFRKFFENRYKPPVRYKHVVKFTTGNTARIQGQPIEGAFGLSNHLSYHPTFELRILPQLYGHYTPFSFYYSINDSKFIFWGPSAHVRYLFNDRGEKTFFRDNRAPFKKLVLNKETFHRFLSNIL